MDYVIGIDGGGSKTVGLIARPNGEILSRVEVSGSNYHVVGIVRTEQILAELVVALLNQAGVASESKITFCLGMAGLGRKSDQNIINNVCNRIGLDRCRVLTHDAKIALVGGLGKLEGVILISGTGAIAYGQTADGLSVRSSGWGHLLGDEGSGYFIGLQALKAIVRAEDGRAQPTKIRDFVLLETGLSTPEDLVTWTYESSKEKISHLSRFVFEAMSLGDEIAKQIIVYSADELVRSAQVVIDKLNLNPAPELVLSGGVMLNQPALVKMIQDRLLGIQIRLVENEPAYGAVLLAINTYFRCLGN